MKVKDLKKSLEDKDENLEVMIPMSELYVVPVVGIEVKGYIETLGKPRKILVIRGLK